MSRERRIIVSVAGLLVIICANIAHISGALRILETVLLIGVVVAEVLLLARIRVVCRNCRSSKLSDQQW
ncbi:MAG TPA: hypothetical protein VKS20_01405 [Candidatus Acidoferrales bacterium]|nr:hypothetical protein [Candidatus Acidoferrales bacterium]